VRVVFLLGDTLDGELVASESVAEEAGNAADCRDTDTGQVMNLAVRQALFEVLNDLPAINERLELGGRA